jgi:hypothetical protein
MNWRGVACDALVIEANIVLCWALAKLREGQAPPVQVLSRGSVTGCEPHSGPDALQVIRSNVGKCRNIVEN